MDLLPRPQWAGPGTWSFDTGGGYTAEQLQRARLMEDLVVRARNERLQQVAGAPLPAIAPVPQLPPQLRGRAIGVDDGLGFDALALSGAGANAAKIESSLSDPSPLPLRQGSGGNVLDSSTAMLAAADMASTTLPLVQGPVAAPDAARRLAEAAARRRSIIPDPWLASPTAVAAPAAPAPAAPPRGSINLDGGGPAAARSMADLDLGGPINVSGGGPGTSTAKGFDTIRDGAARRGMRGMSPRGLASGVDDAMGKFDLGLGGMARSGMRRAGAFARANGMPHLGRALFRAGGAAGAVAPVAALGTAALPAVMGAMDGYAQAGTGGAVIQGGTAAAGALAGAAIGSAVLPGVGTLIGGAFGGMLGSGAGSGLTGLATGAVEKAQSGDTGFMGSIGRALDPLIDTPFEKEQKAALQQMNSPAMDAIRQQEYARQLEAQSAQRQQVLMQAAMRGLL